MEVAAAGAGAAGGPDWAWIGTIASFAAPSLSSGLLKRGNRGVECVECGLDGTATGYACRRRLQFALGLLTLQDLCKCL